MGGTGKEDSGCLVDRVCWMLYIWDLVEGFPGGTVSMSPLLLMQEMQEMQIRSLSREYPLE